MPFCSFSTFFSVIVVRFFLRRCRFFFYFLFISGSVYCEATTTSTSLCQKLLLSSFFFCLSEYLKLYSSMCLCFLSGHIGCSVLIFIAFINSLTVGMLQFLPHTHKKKQILFYDNLLKHLCITWNSRIIYYWWWCDMVVDDVWCSSSLNRQFRNAWLSIVLPISSHFFVLFPTHSSIASTTMQNETKKREIKINMMKKKKTPFFENRMNYKKKPHITRCIMRIIFIYLFVVWSDRRCHVFFLLSDSVFFFVVEAKCFFSKAEKDLIIARETDNGMDHILT